MDHRAGSFRPGGIKLIEVELAERFCRLFAGLDRAHGQYIVQPHKKDGAKEGGLATTEKGAATVELWLKHLRGEANYGLGVIPIMADNTAVFGAIDVDEYPLDLKKLAREVEALKLPLIVCRTKSAGAHLYLFTSEPVPAELMRGKLMEWAVALGYSGVEVFPKQVRLASETDIGNWINMPYQRAEQTMRYAQHPERALSAAEFLALAEKTALTEDQLMKHELPPDEKIDDLLHQAPPCLQTLAKKGFGAGSRNNALFNIAIYLKKRFSDDWPEKLDQFNRRFMNPPLGTDEVTATVKSVKKKTYSYKCKEPPINAVCNRQICLTREFGIAGADAGDPGVVLGDLEKWDTDPPTWVWNVNGARIKLTTEELMDQRLFRKRVLDDLTILTYIMKPEAWSALLRSKIVKAEVVGVSHDVTTRGLWLSHLEAFCTGRAQARSLDELLLGKAFTDASTGRVCFRVEDVLRYFTTQRVTGLTMRAICLFLKDLDGQHHDTRYKGKHFNYWSVAAFSIQTGEHDVPRMDKSAEF